MQIIFYFILLFLLPAVLWAQSLSEKTIDVQTKEKNPSLARPLLMNIASEKASEEWIKEIIGEAKYTRNRSLIQSKVVKKSAAYLPFTKAGEMKVLGDEGFQMSVTVRANIDDLQRILLENGLFYESETAPSLLPVVKWTDRLHSTSFSWWMGSGDAGKSFLMKEARSFENILQQNFLQSGFYLIRPQVLHYENLLSDSDKVEQPSVEKTQEWARAWNASIVLQGHVQMAKGERNESVAIELRLTAVQVQNSRVIAEAVRSFETEPGAFESVVDRKLQEVLQLTAADLSSQIVEAWKQGSINSQLYRLRISGHLSLPAREAFKEVLRSKVREIKSIKERLISSDEILFEMDSSIGPVEVAKKLGNLDVMGTQLAVSQANEKELSLRVQK